MPDDTSDKGSDGDDLPARFALAVKGARERAGMSQAALAEAVGASLDHVGKLERAKYLPGLGVAAKLIVSLGLDANELLRAEPRRRKASRSRLEAEASPIGRDTG